MTADFGEAARNYAAGDFDRAAVVCLDIIRNDVRHFEALHLLGVIAYQQGRLEADDTRDAFNQRLEFFIDPQIWTQRAQPPRLVPLRNADQRRGLGFGEPLGENRGRGENGQGALPG